jgi:uncharacterized membrane protein
MDFGFIQLGIGRWLHIAAGILWLGLLLYFNFVQTPALAAAGQDGTATGITRHVAPRALFYFRWAAVATWVAGAMILGRHFADAFLFLKPAYYAIGTGAWLGTIMLANVWLLIWPCQKKVLGLVPASDEEKARARRLAFIISRVNLLLAVPMLFFMVASGGIFRTQFFG